MNDIVTVEPNIAGFIGRVYAVMGVPQSALTLSSLPGCQRFPFAGGLPP
jgi:hypothetical protein